MARIEKMVRGAESIRGRLVVELRGPDGKVKYRERSHNIVTEIGDQWYAENAVGIGSHGAVTGMQLGTGSTAPSKTGAGAAIVTHVAGSNVAISATYPQSALNSGKRRITWRSFWDEGEATNGALREVALILQALGTDSGAAASDTLARALFGPIDKAAGDTLQITWHHDFGTVP